MYSGRRFQLGPPANHYRAALPNLCSIRSSYPGPGCELASVLGSGTFLPSAGYASGPPHMPSQQSYDVGSSKSCGEDKTRQEDRNVAILSHQPMQHLWSRIESQIKWRWCYSKEVIQQRSTREGATTYGHHRLQIEPFQGNSPQRRQLRPGIFLPKLQGQVYTATASPLNRYINMSTRPIYFLLP